MGVPGEEGLLPGDMLSGVAVPASLHMTVHKAVHFSDAATCLLTP